MKEDFVITVLGKQVLDGEEEKISLSALGTYDFSKDKKVISFYEYDSENANERSKSVIIIDGNDKVSITKNGLPNAQLVLEKGTRHMCHYITDYGAIQLGTYTNKIFIDLDENGGYINCDYEIDINSSVTSYNKIYVKIKKAGGK